MKVLGKRLAKLAMIFWLVVSPLAAATPQPAATRVEGVNEIDAYKVRWWGTENSELDRPLYHVARIDNGVFELRHIIVTGRPLANYVLPYWPIRSCLAIVNRPAELAHQCRVTFSRGGQARSASFEVHEGFELATLEAADVLKITNRGSASPVLLEHFFVIAKDSPAIQVVARITNTSDEPLTDVEQQVLYQQQFNWGQSVAAQEEDYVPVEPETKGEAHAFHAFSPGMQRGYEFVAGENCRLQYECSGEMNRWQVTFRGQPKTLGSDESTSMHYVVRTTDRHLSRPTPARAFSVRSVSQAEFRRVAPTLFKKAPIREEGRVMLPRVVQDLRRPKIRGLNLRAGFPEALEDLETLDNWGCNLVITAIGNPERTRRIIERGHELGLEMFVAGRGRWTQGSPRFEKLYDKPLSASQQADSHGQDEDHYYWYGHQPTRDFQSDFGKPMAEATQSERVRYWARCFSDRWRAVLKTVRQHAPHGGIWFYMPTPSVAHVDPLDHYDVFFREVAKLGSPLTVFPFYYGVEYNQAEYMVRRWKDAGVERVAFLPMRGFMSRPSQFIRAITAARRGQADGTCGFAFPVSAEKPGNAWQWKSVMLAAQANFPTPELHAFCFIEEPAELVEKMACADVVIVPGETDMEELVQRLGQLLPGRVQTDPSAPNDSAQSVLTVLVNPASTKLKSDWPVDMGTLKLGAGKGVIQMRDRTVGLFGSDPAGVAHAIELLTRFAELVPAECQAKK